MILSLDSQLATPKVFKYQVSSKSTHFLYFGPPFRIYEFLFQIHNDPTEIRPSTDFYPNQEIL